MWFEILPSYTIVVLAMAIPHTVAPLLNALIVGNRYRRALFDKDQRIQYLRDRRLTGDPYKVAGLESLEDVNEEEEEKKRKGKQPPEPPRPPHIDPCADK